MGEGYQEFMGAVCYQRSGYPDLGVRMGIQNGLYYPLGPWAVDVLFISYKGIQDDFEELWRAWLRIGRGTGDSSALWSGVCRRLARLHRSLPSSIEPYVRLPLPEEL
jgi:hypothetical protein